MNQGVSNVYFHPMEDQHWDPVFMGIRSKSSSFTLEYTDYTNSWNFDLDEISDADYRKVMKRREEFNKSGYSTRIIETVVIIDYPVSNCNKKHKWPCKEPFHCDCKVM